MSIRKQIVLWIGGILIILRLFFPIEERVTCSPGGTKFITDDSWVAKRVVVSKTAFQCIGIGVLIGLLFISINGLKKKK